MFQYSPNIGLNPCEYFGTWTPEGWRTHKIEFQKTHRKTVTFDGDGRSICFRGLPEGFVEAVHDRQDPYSDGGIYPVEPLVECPPGHARWAVSHTFLAYPVADQTLYQQQYTWDAECGSVETRFRQHVVLEEARTDAETGRRVRVRNAPLSTVIAGNKNYPLCNSAVRGVWGNPDKVGRNYYARREVRLCTSHNAVYIKVDQSPVLQCLGIWKAGASDMAAFNDDGELRDPRRLSDVPLDCPKLGAVGYALKKVSSAFYGKMVDVVEEGAVLISEDMLASLLACRDVPFMEARVGFAAWRCWDHERHVSGVPGHYACHWDFNGNGVVDEEDEMVLRQNLGRKVRANYYSAAYFGNDWLSAGILLNPEMVGEPVICCWDRGAGYDASSSEIDLFESPGADRPVYVEYHYDMPAETGKANVLVHLGFEEGR